MKEIKYSDGEKFILTNNEFVDAMVAWRKEDGSYWCERLEALLPKFILYAQTPPEEKGREMFLVPLFVDHRFVKMRRIFKAQNGAYYEILSGGGTMEILSEERKDMVSQEDYYNKKLYLNSPK